ncbi:DUF1304 domain-containing protein [Gordonia araii]|nr:DUF1304 domain-containing protein [Gordonia araii]NNG95937.1 DUF1304 domain-containing protein [Gordonia araii NBRC 100433]
MLTAGLVVALLAAALHVFIFYLESLAWTTPRARAVFGTSREEAEATRELAYNQGFYNLFLAVMVVVGALIVVTSDHRGVGLALVLAGSGAMLAAALVLGLSSPSHRGAAAKQGALPLIAVVGVVVGLLLG